MSWLTAIANTQNDIDQKRLGVIQDLDTLKFGSRLIQQLAHDIGLINQIWDRRLQGTSFSKFLGGHHFKAERGGSLAVSVELVKDYLIVIYHGEGMPEKFRMPLECRLEIPGNGLTAYITSPLLPSVSEVALNDVERFSKFILEPVAKAVNNLPLPELD